MSVEGGGGEEEEGATSIFAAATAAAPAVVAVPDVAPVRLCNSPKDVVTQSSEFPMARGLTLLIVVCI